MIFDGQMNHHWSLKTNSGKVPSITQSEAQKLFSWKYFVDDGIGGKSKS